MECEGGKLVRLKPFLESQHMGRPQLLCLIAFCYRVVESKEPSALLAILLLAFIFPKGKKKKKNCCFFF